MTATGGQLQITGRFRGQRLGGVGLIRLHLRRMATSRHRGCRPVGALLHRRMTSSGRLSWCAIARTVYQHRGQVSRGSASRHVIMLAVRWYLRYGLSYRDVEELLIERGIQVDHVTVYRWVQRFTPLLIDAARPCRHATGDRWFVDETYVKIAGRWVYLYRAIDQFGHVIDVLVAEKRDLAATRRFVSRALDNRPCPF